MTFLGFKLAHRYDSTPPAGGRHAFLISPVTVQPRRNHHTSKAGALQGTSVLFLCGWIIYDEWLCLEEGDCGLLEVSFLCLF